MVSCTWPAVVQALAYVVLAGVAVVTYVQARKTILMPLRTKVFEVQMGELQEIVAALLGKQELDLRRDFGFDDLVRANAVKMYDRFFRDVYGVEQDENQRPYAPHLCSSSIVHENQMWPQTEEAGPHFFRSQRLLVALPRPGDRDSARDWWREYSSVELCLPDTMMEAEQRLVRAASSPLLPDAVSSVISALARTIDQNRLLLLDALTTIGRELPDRHAEVDPPDRIDMGRVSDLYHSQFQPLQPRAAAVVRAVRLYWHSQGLI